MKVLGFNGSPRKDGKRDVEKDEEGLMLASALGQRMAWLLKKLYE